MILSVYILLVDYREVECCCGVHAQILIRRFEPHHNQMMGSIVVMTTSLITVVWHRSVVMATVGKDGLSELADEKNFNDV